jgi:hypothetical protein
MKPICVTFAWGKYKTWKLLYDNCINSFKKWHPDIELRIITDSEYEGKVEDLAEPYIASLWRFKVCRKMFDEGYTKVIMIGLDTFATSRWDEMINDTTTPLLGVLGGPFCLDPDVKLQQLFLPRHNWYENMTICADLVCFNFKWVIDDLLTILDKYKRHDNHAIDLYANELKPEACKIVDWPYAFSPYVYYCRASWFGILGSECINEDGTIRWGIGGPTIGKFSPTLRYLPIEDKLYNHVGKHIKAFCFEKSISKERMDQYLNKETIEWFKEYCNVDMYL